VQAPTASLVRSLSRVDFAAEGYTDDAQLAIPVGWATDYVGFVTARPCDETMPAMLAGMALQAVVMRTEQIVMVERPENVETVGDIDMISNFSAGAYSETRFETRSRPERAALNAWPPLNDLLWLLLGLLPGEVNDVVSDRYDYWVGLLTGMHAPAWGIVEVDWARHGSMMPPPYFQISPWDMWTTASPATNIYPVAGAG
jgi:hypothetical protein